MGQRCCCQNETTCPQAVRRHDNELIQAAVLRIHQPDTDPLQSVMLQDPKSLWFGELQTTRTVHWLESLAPSWRFSAKEHLSEQQVEHLKLGIHRWMQARSHCSSLQARGLSHWWRLHSSWKAFGHPCVGTENLAYPWLAHRTDSYLDSPVYSYPHYDYFLHTWKHHGSVIVWQHETGPGQTAIHRMHHGQGFRPGKHRLPHRPHQWQKSSCSPAAYGILRNC